MTLHNDDNIHHDCHINAAPTGAPRNLRVTAINRTAMEIQWSLPPFDSRGGIIRGYRLFIQPAEGGEEAMINIMTNVSDTYTVGNLEPDTMYRFSMLVYTSVGDGPRSMPLTTATLSKII